VSRTDVVGDKILEEHAAELLRKHGGDSVSWADDKCQEVVDYLDNVGWHGIATVVGAGALPELIVTAFIPASAQPKDVHAVHAELTHMAAAYFDKFSITIVAC
jgi:hypothetical protein